MRKLHDGAIETRSVLLGLLVIEHALQKGKRMLFEEGRQRLELLVAWLLKVVERHKHKELVGDVVIWQEALDARLDAQPMGHVIDGAPIESVRALERGHGRVWQ